MPAVLFDDEEPPSDTRGISDVLKHLPAFREAQKINTLSPVHRRILTPRDTTQDDDPRLAFQHTVLCQTHLPYSDPGDAVREWECKQGTASLLIEAGKVLDPATQEWRKVGLPWGTKPRLILAYLNGEALRQGSPVIEIENSLSAFVARIRGFKSGREISAFKNQLTRLSAALIRLAIARNEHHTCQIESKIITAFDLWLHKDERQRLLWPSTIRLSHEYFNSLQDHAVPLHEADLAALAHSAVALDLYAWLAQRLHRMDPNRPVFIQWPALMQQFGPDYKRMEHFKPSFRKALRQVLVRYETARVELDGSGMRLHHSPPPVAKRFFPSAKPTT
jgi:hypothetical protein